MPGIKDQLLNRLDDLASMMVTNRTQRDVQMLLDLLAMAFDDMTDDQITAIHSNLKGAYNPSDRDRVSDYCNILAEVMASFYGVVTPGYHALPDDWVSITDPTKGDLKDYIDNILALKTYWLNEMGIEDNFPIDHIYNGISLETANNIEKALKAIHEAINKYIFSIDSRYCGQMYGDESGSMIACGLALQNDTSQYGIWTGAN